MIISVKLKGQALLEKKLSHLADFPGLDMHLQDIAEQIKSEVVRNLEHEGLDSNSVAILKESLKIRSDDRSLSIHIGTPLHKGSDREFGIHQGQKNPWLSQAFAKVSPNVTKGVRSLLASAVRQAARRSSS